MGKQGTKAKAKGLGKQVHNIGMKYRARHLQRIPGFFFFLLVWSLSLFILGFCYYFCFIITSLLLFRSLAKRQHAVMCLRFSW